MPRAKTKAQQKTLDTAKKALSSFMYCYPELSRHGKLTVFYWRGKGTKRVRIRDEIGTKGFSEVYWAIHENRPLPESALTTIIAPQPARKSIAEKPTLGWLISQYTHSTNPQWRKLKESTKKSRNNILNLIRAQSHPSIDGYTFADWPLDKFSPKWVKYLRDSRIRWEVTIEEGEEVEVMSNTESANSWLKVLRALFKWAVNHSGLDIHVNPTLGISAYPGNSDGFYCWSPEDVEKFRNTYPIGTKERLAMELLIRTLQRRGDIVRLGRQWLTKDSQGRSIFKFRQEKNGGTAKAVTAYVPFFDDLQQIVEATSSAGEMVFLVSERGTPWVKESFTNWFRDVCDHAGLPQCSAHGLRKAGIVELIRQNYPKRQIMAISGHTTEKQFDHYARSYMRQHAMEQLLDDYNARQVA